MNRERFTVDLLWLMEDDDDDHKEEACIDRLIPPLSLVEAINIRYLPEDENVFISQEIEVVSAADHELHPDH